MVEYFFVYVCILPYDEPIYHNFRVLHVKHSNV